MIYRTTRLLVANTSQFTLLLTQASDMGRDIQCCASTYKFIGHSNKKMAQSYGLPCINDIVHISPSVVLFTIQVLHLSASSPSQAEVDPHPFAQAALICPPASPYTSPSVQLRPDTVPPHICYSRINGPSSSPIRTLNHTCQVTAESQGKPESGTGQCRLRDARLVPCSSGAPVSWCPRPCSCGEQGKDAPSVKLICSHRFACLKR